MSSGCSFRLTCVCAEYCTTRPETFANPLLSLVRRSELCLLSVVGRRRKGVTTAPPPSRASVHVRCPLRFPYAKVLMRGLVDPEGPC